MLLIDPRLNEKLTFRSEPVALCHEQSELEILLERSFDCTETLFDLTQIPPSTEPSNCKILISFRWQIRNCIEDPEFDLLEYLSIEAIQTLLDQGASLVFLFSYESFPEFFICSTGDCLVRWAHRIAERLEVSSDRFTLLAPDMAFEKNYSSWLETQKLPRAFRPLSINFFERETFLFFQQKGANTGEQVEHITHKAVVMAARSHAFRTAVFYFLSTQNLLADFLYSFLNRDGYLNRGDPELRQWLTLIDQYFSPTYSEAFDQFIMNIPHRLDPVEADQVDHEFPSRNVKRAAIHIVLETDFSSENALFLTEKIYKPIWNKQPFLVFGHPGTLEYLRSCGYMTFPELIDETYDQIRDPKRRFLALLHEIRRLCSRDLKQLTEYLSSERTQEKLEHNHRLLCERNQQLAMFQGCEKVF